MYVGLYSLVKPKDLRIIDITIVLCFLFFFVYIYKINLHNVDKINLTILTKYSLYFFKILLYMKTLFSNRRWYVNL